MTAEMVVFSVYVENSVTDRAVVMSSFQSLGQAVANKRSPTVMQNDGWTASCLEDDERRRVRNVERIKKKSETVKFRNIKPQQVAERSGCPVVF